MSEIKILDACCGGKMFWFNKHEPHTTYLDNR
ncbi:SAM-dependent methyltransferase, partial [Lactobacillus acidophilus]|nr:SAM-dependent methyltransferase [Lactobacillus acidophilus]MCT3603213.1 SAM-dependent methyltransferase [Lactobacillus acidophilus]